MSRFSTLQFVTGAVGVLAVTLTLGAAQLASGQDLRLAGPSSDTVNRANKTDRIAVRQQIQPSETVSVYLPGQGGSSVHLRISAPGDARVQRAPIRRSPQSRTRMVACEAVVSVLTEAARHLEPGRCVT